MNTAESAGSVVTTTPDLSIISLVTSSDFVGKGVIFILVLASIWSWAIIISKILQYSAIRKKMKSFEASFWSGQVIDELYEKIKKTIDNPLSAVFVSALNECKKNKNTEQKKSETLRVGHKDRVLGSMYLSRNREIERLELKLGFLATVGASAPFIGLFGTVWGIMGAFQKIGQTGMASLAVVAPGISEALIATAVGLAAAIPATIFYNHFLTKIQRTELNLNNFAADFLNITKRNFFVLRTRIT